MFTISNQPIDPSKLREELNSPEAGAYASFEGIVRNHNDGQSVTALEYEAYSELCQSEGEKIIGEAKEEFSIIKACCVHRAGKLNIGDMAVWVGVTAAHREDAFKACRYIIDEVKKRLPVWKKEYYANGDSGWINCDLSDPSPDLSRIPLNEFKQFELVDVREEYEREYDPLSGAESTHLPLSEFDPNNVPFKSTGKYLIFCAHGIRSLQLVQFLREKGFNNLYNVVNGISTLREYLNQQKTNH